MNDSFIEKNSSLKSCLCDWPQERTEELMDEGERRYRVRCLNCQTQTVLFIDPETASEIWNAVCAKEPA